MHNENWTNSHRVLDKYVYYYVKISNVFIYI
jgi:hypothetical protein